MAADPNFANVVLLCHFDGTNGQTTATDSSSSAKTITGHGSVVLSNTQSKFGGTSSSHLNSSSNYWSLAATNDFTFGGGDFTIESWVYLNSSAKFPIMGIWDSLATFANWYLFFDGTNLLFRYYNTSDSVQNLSVAWTPLTNQWVHICVDYVFSSNTLRMYVNGSMVAKSTSLSSAFKSSTINPLRIGNISSNATYTLNGFLDDIRITKGVARYASDAGFSVPTAAYPDSATDISGTDVTQQVLSVATSSDPNSRVTRQGLLVSGDTDPKSRVTQQVLIVAARKGHKVSFSQFKEPTFHDWVSTGDNVNYQSYLITWYDIPATIEWSQTPYSYYFLKNGTIDDKSLKVQYRWDYSRKN